MLHRRLRGAVTAIFWMAAFMPSAEAQTLEGRIVDAETGQPVASAYVAVVTRDRLSTLATVSGRDGSFSIDVPGEGSYYIYASSLGYKPSADGLFDFEPDGWLELEIRLQPDPVLLASITAGVERTDDYLRDVGFYERRDHGFGSHLTGEEVRRRAVFTLVDAIRDLPRVHVGGEGMADGTPRTDFATIVMRDGQRVCPPHIFLDGVFVHRGGLRGDFPPPDGPAMPDAFVHPMDVAAIEVYPGGVARPPQYALPGGCGVILIWTNH